MTVVGGLVGCQCGVAGSWGDLAVEAPVVEPVDVGHGGVFDVDDALPGAVPVDEFPLVEAVERLGEGVVVAVAALPDRGDALVGGEPVGVADRQVLDAAVGVTHQAVEAGCVPVGDRHLQRVDRQVGAQRLGGLPADDGT